MARIDVRPAVSELLAGSTPLGALVLLPDDGTTCCRVGFDVVALPAGEPLPDELVALGDAAGVPVYAAWPLDAAGVAQVIVGLDDATGDLVAVLS